ncbi:MAG: hypothetical protein JWN04_1415 [Myxococcaceae bacterium]|nr:hypothetical protein [Myxococcaceae bacterium]
MTGGHSLQDQLKALAKLLASYWNSTKPNQLQEGHATKRHNLLLGPALGIPVTQRPTRLVLLGALLELGGNDYFRAGVAGGIQVRYGDALGPPGWFAGLSLSGTFADDLFHIINGGLSSSRAVVAAP